MRVLLLSILSLFFFCSFMACDGEPSKVAGTLEPPNILEPGKDDGIGDFVNMRGRISFGAEVFGEFVEDDQLEGWFFTASAGSVITADNSNLGTSRNLDSTLFLYGPKRDDGFYGSVVLVFDDDSGWGTHARIKDFTIPADGEYLIVMGTFLNIDRGRYRLALLCNSGSCLVPCDENCPSSDPCSGQICSVSDGCIDAEPDPQCNAEKNILVDKAELLTGEGNESDDFTVRLTQEPESHVTVWVLSSNHDEACVYPQKLLFCAVGFEETANGCKPLEDGFVRDEPHWQRVIPVTVTGVNDYVSDGDVSYSLNFEVVSEDSEYVEAVPESIPCVNLDMDMELGSSGMAWLLDEELCAALLPLVDGHRAYGYLGQNSARTIMFSAVDLHDDLVESIYNGVTTRLPRDSSQAYAQGFNSEHTWPQAQFDKIEPMKSDLHHIFPCDVRNNSIRSSYDFGMTNNPFATSSVLGASLGGRVAKVYQVRPERRGDIARAHFYMAVRYRITHTEGMLFDDDVNLFNGCINDLEEKVLRRWHEADPVDELERSRNNRIQAYQGNRNPFVDWPELVEQISDF
ncbi:MAG: endonuclease [Deltaproteobacteria bacterium]|nr:endonuclease [Deltaproteobacteria bacterium]